MNKLNILFVLAKNRIKKDGTAPLFCRLTYLEVRKQFATGRFLIPKEWNNFSQSADPYIKENENTNNQLSLIKNKLNEAFLLLQLQGQEFNVEDIYNQYKGVKPKKDKRIVEAFMEHNSKVEKLIGKDYAKPTFWKYRQACELLKGYLRHKYKRNDYYFKDLDLKFLQGYEFYLKTEKNLAQATVNKTIQRFRKIVKIAIGEGFLDRDPFVFYKVKRIKKEIVFLTDIELSKLKNHLFTQPRLELVRDMFIFCCYTGLAYNEMNKLEYKHIERGFDENQWIKMVRDKTERVISIPLLSKPVELIEKYNVDKTTTVFPSISNQKFNSYLKEIADIVGIEKNLTHHIARKTFATTILLYNDVPMEIVSELLGHSKITITQEHYAKVVQKKVSEHIGKLSKKLKS